MDPISLTASILTIVNETYVVANFIYRTIKSAKNADAEFENIMSSMRVELLFLRSFLVYFERARGSIIQVRDLDEVGLIIYDQNVPTAHRTSSYGSRKSSIYYDDFRMTSMIMLKP